MIETPEKRAEKYFSGGREITPAERTWLRKRLAFQCQVMIEAKADFKAAVYDTLSPFISGFAKVLRKLGWPE